MADQGAKGGDRKEKKRPTIRDLDPNAQVRKPVERVDPMAELIKKYGKKEDQKKTESDEDFDDGIRVPGVIPAQVKPLSSDVPTALLPRHQVVLQELINGRGSTRTASFPWKQLGDAGAMELAKVLSSGTGKSLEALDVSCNQIGSRGAIQIANTAGALPALETLNLGANGIGDEGAQAVAAAIVASESITFLDLHACAIGDKGASALAEALQDNFVLRALDLKANYIGDAGARALATAAQPFMGAALTELRRQKHKGLRALVLSSNDITEAGQGVLDSAFEANLNLSPFIPAEILRPPR